MGAVILAADTLATEWFFKDDYQLTIEDILPYLKTESDINRCEKAHESIRTWIITNPQKFDISQDGFYGRYVEGTKSSTYYAFVQYQFEKLAQELGFSSKDYLNWAKDHGYLLTDSDRKRLTKKVKMGNSNEACYCIVLER